MNTKQITAANVDELMEQREQSQACLRSATKETLGLSKNFAESRQRKAKGQYARVSVELPENEEKKSRNQELAYEIEPNDINDEFTVKF